MSRTRLTTHIYRFGVNTYKLLNSKGESYLVKFHFTPHLGVHSFVWDEALKLAGQDPDFHRKDLWTAIEGGQYPKWDFGIQTIPESQADDFDFDPLDATKIWPEEDFPVRYIGELELNRNVRIHTMQAVDADSLRVFIVACCLSSTKYANICILAR